MPGPIKQEMEQHIVLGNRIPREFFITSGKGQSDSSSYPAAYHFALDAAGVSNCNLMTYSSILPAIAVEIPQRSLEHGCVVEAIQAKADGNKGQRITAGISYGWLFDHNDEKTGGVVVEYGGNKDIEGARNFLHGSLEELVAKSRKFKGLHLGPITHRIESFVPTKNYGTALVLICFVDYVHPIVEGEDSKK